MKLNESYGIITKEDIQWDKLCDLICQYIFDLKSGMVSNPLYDENNQHITLDNIDSYYNYKYHHFLGLGTFPIGHNFAPLKQGKYESQRNDNHCCSVCLYERCGSAETSEPIGRKTDGRWLW